MRIELDLEPAEVGIMLDALADYHDRAMIEAGGGALASTGPSDVVVYLARAVDAAQRTIIDQLAPYADAIPAVSKLYPPTLESVIP